MFVGDEVLLDVGFAVARARLANLTRGGSLRDASEDAYGTGIADLLGAGGSGRAGLARVQIRELAEADDCAGLAIRWEVTGADGGLFPVLDADIKLNPAADRATALTLAGVYRPDTADEARVRDPAPMASAVIRNFLGRVAAGITGQPGPAVADGPGHPGFHDRMAESAA